VSSVKTRHSTEPLNLVSYNKRRGAAGDDGPADLRDRVAGIHHSPKIRGSRTVIWRSDAVSALGRAAAKSKEKASAKCD
jgi:hypothetical protein